jgi:hypothetical protein
MPHPFLKEYQSEIEKYCGDNNLSVDKVFSSWTAGNKEIAVILGEGDPERGKLGLADNVPLPIALEIHLEEGTLRFEQTEYTRKYLGVADNAKAGRRVA